jgi:hypothetical protein
MSQASQFCDPVCRKCSTPHSFGTTVCSKCSASLLINDIPSASPVAAIFVNANLNGAVAPVITSVPQANKPFIPSPSAEIVYVPMDPPPYQQYVHPYPHAAQPTSPPPIPIESKEEMEMQQLQQPQPKQQPAYIKNNIDIAEVKRNEDDDAELARLQKQVAILEAEAAQYQSPQPMVQPRPSSSPAASGLSAASPSQSPLVPVPPPVSAPVPVPVPVSIPTGPDFTQPTRTWSVAMVAQWIQSLGATFTTYVDAFISNGVTGSLLMSVLHGPQADEVLRTELNISSALHRLRITGEIAKLR